MVTVDMTRVSLDKFFHDMMSNLILSAGKSQDGVDV